MPFQVASLTQSPNMSLPLQPPPPERRRGHSRVASASHLNPLKSIFPPLHAIFFFSKLVGEWFIELLGSGVLFLLNLL